jgi:hypothetical protein
LADAVPLNEGGEIAGQESSSRGQLRQVEVAAAVDLDEHGASPGGDAHVPGLHGQARQVGGGLEETPFKSSAKKVEISVGELIDKLTILQIKAERIGDADKRANVRSAKGSLGHRNAAPGTLLAGARGWPPLRDSLMRPRRLFEPSW